MYYSMTQYSQEFLRHINAAVDSTTTPAKIHQFLHDRWMEGHDGWADRLSLERKIEMPSFAVPFEVFHLTAHENGKPTGVVQVTPNQVITKDCGNPRCIQYRLGMWMLAEQVQPLGSVVKMAADFSGVGTGNRFVGMMLCNAAFNSGEDVNTNLKGDDYETCARYDVAKTPASAFTFDRDGLTFRDPKYMQGSEAHGKRESPYAYPFALTLTDGWMHVMLPKGDPLWLQWPPKTEEHPKLELSPNHDLVLRGDGCINIHGCWVVLNPLLHGIQGSSEDRPEGFGFCLYKFHLDARKWAVPVFKFGMSVLEYQFPCDDEPTLIPYPLAITISSLSGEPVLEICIHDDDPRLTRLSKAERDEYDMGRNAVDQIQAREADLDRAVNKAKVDYKTMIEGGNEQ